MADDWLTARARRSPEALALLWQGQPWSYGALARESATYTAALAHLGVRRGQHVAAMLPNGPAYVRLVHALARLGAVLVPLNQRLTPPETAWQVQQADCRWFVHDDSTAPAAAAAPAPITPIDVAALQDGPGAPPTPQFDLHALQAIVFTSGTTGRPKGAMLTFGNHFWSATASAFRLGLQANDRWLSSLPLCHVGGLAVLFRSCLYGTAVVLHDGFDLQQFNASLDHEQVTITSLVPTMLYRLLRSRSHWPRSLRLALTGGAATTPELARQCAAAGVPLAATYGLTETASQVATMTPPETQRKPGCVGKPLMFGDVRIAGQDGESLGLGQVGEVCVNGPMVMQGYYGDPQATAAALRHGELRTGDIGYLDDDGDLWLVQRRSDVIVSGGENVYPAEVEGVLRQHPAVSDACVVGLPHEEWGQQVAVMVALEPERRVAEEALLQFCRERLAGYKIPRRLRLVDELPHTASGKVARAAVLEALAAEQDA